jgi:dimethylaniline monooxygenase (N-oxide forming)
METCGGETLKTAPQTIGCPRTQDTESARKRVAIIGAGPSGLVTLKELAGAGHDVVVFEARDKLGGLFNDSFQDLQLTTSSVTTSFGSFFRDEDLERGAVIWSGGEYLKYLAAFVKHFDLLRYIRLSTRVVSLRRDNPTGGWTVCSVSRGDADDAIVEEEHSFDHVAICCGANAAPVSPSWPGHNLFAGRIVHSAELRGAEDFAGKRILVVGLGESGSDIALAAAKVAKATVLSSRNGPGYVIPRLYRGSPSDLDTNRCYHSLARSLTGARLVRFKTRIEEALYGEHDNLDVVRAANKINLDRGLSPFHRFGTKNTSFIEAMLYYGADYRPDVARLTSKRVVFTDGSEFECDLIVCCTGYQTMFPFLVDSEPELCEAATKPRRLFKRMFAPELGASVAFIGFVRPGLGSVFTCAEMQARYFALLVNSETRLPSPEDMQRDIALHARLDIEQFPDDALRISTLTDYLRFLDSVAECIGCRPSLRQTFLRDPITGCRLLFAPLNGAQYRLVGPGSEPERARAILRRLPTMPWLVLAYELALLTICTLLGFNRDRWRTKSGGMLPGSKRGGAAATR